MEGRQEKQREDGRMEERIGLWGHAKEGQRDQADMVLTS